MNGLQWQAQASGFCKQPSGITCTILQSVCAEAASFDLPAAALAGAMEEARAALEAALVRRERDSAGGAQAVSSSTLQEVLESCVLLAAAVQREIAGQMVRIRQT